MQQEEQATPKITWGPLSAVLITVGGFLLSQVIAGLLIYAYPYLRGWTDVQTTEWLKQASGQFIYIVLAESIVLWIIFAFLQRRKASLKYIGLRRPRGIDVLYALCGYGVYFVIYIGLFAISQKLLPQINFNQKQELGFNTSASGIDLAMVFASLVILPPVVEEIVCRGFLYSGLRSKLPKISAAIITSIIFAAAHLQFGSGNALLWVAAMDTFLLSLVLVYLREKTGSLWAGIGVHAIKNCLAFVVLFIFKAA